VMGGNYLVMFIGWDKYLNLKWCTNKSKNIK
jgi:hypothetical protein